jgi:hypothetical protein
MVNDLEREIARKVVRFFTSSFTAMSRCAGIGHPKGIDLPVRTLGECAEGWGTLYRREANAFSMNSIIRCHTS